MSDKKLTPREGDRVIGVLGGSTHAGTVYKCDGVQALVKWTMEIAGRASFWTERFPIGDLTVVDRDPVEWPEGWEEGDHYAWGPDRVAVHRNANLGFSKQNLREILATGPDMLARWDELVGGGE